LLKILAIYPNIELPIISSMEIKLCQSHQADEIFSILRDCKNSLDKLGIFQWTDHYPTLAIVENDIERGHVYCAVLGSKCVGTINVNEEEEPEYAAVTWNDNTGRVLVVHRLAVDPAYQGQGIAKALMDFAEQYGTDNGYSSVRLDAFSTHERVLKFYMNRGYQKRGEVFFPGRISPFFCYEKLL
jgi:ribosomal protein S18 acetylase RimI-like enzyme